MSTENKFENNILYTKEFCPYCIRVRSVMSDLSVEMEIRDINDSDENRIELIEGGGKQQVPCLYFKESGAWMYESEEIIGYIKETL